MTEPPPPHMGVDKEGMMKGYAGYDDEDDNDEEEMQHEGRLQLEETNVTFSTYSRGGKNNMKNKKLKTHHQPTYWSSTANPNQVPSSIKVKTTTDSQLSSSIPGLSSILDMSMTEIEADAHKNLIKSCVRKNVFPIWKFYQKAFDSHYSQDETTLCGFILRHTKIKGDESWWVEMRKLIVKTHTDMRNNAIKNMQTKFKGMSQHQINRIKLENKGC
jgi:hypothetical protein